MTTTQKIIFTPAAPQDTTANAGQNRDRLRSERDELAAICQDWSLKFSDKCKAVEKWSQGYSNIHAQLENTERERDRLSVENEIMRRDLDAGKRQFEAQREQVKTLLTACKAFANFSYYAIRSAIGEVGALAEFVRLKRATRLAIASVESEEAK